jgi:hypothetical protein
VKFTSAGTYQTTSELPEDATDAAGRVVPRPAKRDALLEQQVRLSRGSG